MRASRGDLEAAPQDRVTAEVGEVGQLTIGISGRLDPGRGLDRPLSELTELSQVLDRHHIDLLHERGLTRVLRRDRDTAQPPPSRPLRHRQGTGGGPDGAVERQLTGHRVVVDDQLRELSRRRQDRGRDRQVEARADLGDVGGGEVHSDPMVRVPEAGVPQRRAHPLPGLTDGRIGEADDREGGQTAADVHFHVDGLRVHPEQGEGTGEREHGPTLGPSPFRNAFVAIGARPGSPPLTGSEPMTFARQRLGRTAERLVAERLERAGWRIVGRNVRLPSGELDLVALDGDTLVFVEVKAGRVGAALGPELPAHAVGRRKQLKLRRLAREWIWERRGPSGVAGYRFDVVGVSFGPDGVHDVDHIRSAF